MQSTAVWRQVKQAHCICGYCEDQFCCAKQRKRLMDSRLRTRSIKRLNNPHEHVQPSRSRLHLVTPHRRHEHGTPRAPTCAAVRVETNIATACAGGGTSEKDNACNSRVRLASPCEFHYISQQLQFLDSIMHEQKTERVMHHSNGTNDLSARRSTQGAAAHVHRREAPRLHACGHYHESVVAAQRSHGDPRRLG